MVILNFSDSSNAFNYEKLKYIYNIYINIYNIYSLEHCNPDFAITQKKLISPFHHFTISPFFIATSPKFRTFVVSKQRGKCLSAEYTPKHYNPLLSP